MKQFRETQYYISPNGHIINNKTGKKLKQSNDKDGYKRATLIIDYGNRKTFRVHRIVAEVYCSNYKEHLQVNHIDGNKANNNYKNLEWVTCQENIKHSWKTGLKHKNYTQEELNEINRKAQHIRYSKLNDVEKEVTANLGAKNGAFGKNYAADKTATELKAIRDKKILANKLNSHKHLYKGGNPISVNGVIYKSINAMSKETKFSFKYIKRRIESKDYKEWYFILTQGGLPNEN